MDPKNDDKKWITREGAKKLNSRSFSVNNCNVKNKKISRNKSVNILPSWERKHHHSITKFIKKAPSPNFNVEKKSKGMISRTETFDNESVSNKVAIFEQFHDSEETKITLKNKTNKSLKEINLTEQVSKEKSITELVSKEKSITEQFQNGDKELKMTIKPKTDPVIQLPLCSFSSNNSNHGSSFCNKEINSLQIVKAVLNEKSTNMQLINQQKFDISTDCTIHNQQSSFSVSNNMKSEGKYIHKQCYDLNEIFEVPKIPYKVKTLEERISSIVKSEDGNFTLKTKVINDFNVISLKYRYKPQIIGYLSNIFKSPNFKHKRLSVKERLSKII